MPTHDWMHQDTPIRQTARDAVRRRPTFAEGLVIGAAALSFVWCAFEALRFLAG